MIDQSIGATIAAGVRTKPYRDNLDSVNVVGEIPGDSRAGELVMLGGHFDSTAAAFAAADNGARWALMMEAAGNLEELEMRLGRTVRIALRERGRAGSA